MKTNFSRIMAVVMCLAVLASVLACTVSATNKSDLLAAAAKSPVYKYVQPSLENAARSIEITDEQAAQILPLVEKAVAAISADKGATYFDKNKGVMYTAEQLATVEDCVAQACAILGFTYKFIPQTNMAHPGDVRLAVYNADGKVVYEFDGDAVADTAAVESAPAVELFAVAGLALLLAAAAAYVVARKRIED